MGISRRAFYLHFASRTELLTSLTGYANEVYDLEPSLAPVLSAGDAEARIAAWVAHLAGFHSRRGRR